MAAEFKFPDVVAAFIYLITLLTLLKLLEAFQTHTRQGKRPIDKKVYRPYSKP